MAGQSTRTACAIIGAACRLPGADELEALWPLLAAGRQAIVDIPAERWDAVRLHAEERGTPGRSVSRRAGLIAGIDRFDAAFFGISAREAQSIDPQQRLILETAWHALEDALLDPTGLAARRVGVYAAIMANDYQQHVASPFRAPDGHAALGGYGALLANRVSHALGLRGESVTVDAACASSLLALHQARRALLTGEVDLCLVAAASAILAPWKMVSFSQAGMLSADGRCKTFGAAADGYVPGEGVVVLVLCRQADAEAAGHRPHALLLGTAASHNGRPDRGITAPSVAAQQATIEAALAAAGVNAAAVSYIEAHGTGTALGDPIEVEALRRAYRPSGMVAPGLAVGSIKSNVGHLEAAAGLAGIVKLLAMFRHRALPPTLGSEPVNPLIAADPAILAPVRRLVPWDGAPRLAGISAMGFGGANAHAILAEPPPAPPLPAGEAMPFLLLSARDPSAATVLAKEYEAAMAAAGPDAQAAMRDSSVLGRAALPWRRVVPAGAPILPAEGHGFAPVPAEPGRIGLLLGEVPALDDALLAAVPALAAMTGDGASRLARLLADLGLRPDLVIGHDAGAFPHARRLDLAAGTVLAPVGDAAGRIRELAASALADRPAIARLLDLAERLRAGNRTFAALERQWREGGDDSEPALAFAAAGALDATCRKWDLTPPAELAGWPGSRLALLAADGLVSPAEALRALVGDEAAVAGRLAALDHLPDPARHGWLAEQRPEPRPAGPERLDLLLVLGGAPVLLPAIEAAETIRLEPPIGGEALLMALARLWRQGLAIDWHRLGRPWRRAGLPPYPFTRQRHWLPRLPDATKMVLWETGQRLFSHAPATEPIGSEPLALPLIEAEPSPGPDLVHGIAAAAAATLDMTPDQILPDRPLIEQGLDSIVLIDLAARLRELLGRPVAPAEIDPALSVRALARRLAPGMIAASRPATVVPARKAEPAPASVRRLVVGETGLLDTLRMVEAPLPPADGTVEVQVEAAGVNFRDVMAALGAHPPLVGEPLGLECAGRLVEGAGALAAGTPVVALLRGGGFAERVRADRRLVRPLPAGLSMPEAAGLPIVLVTAWRTLVELGGLRAGQTVLIHAATGGLGQAAIAVARHVGARIVATAGSEAKRLSLRRQGIEDVADSRRPGFAQTIWQATNGRGADLVLNCLTGALVDEGLDSLALGGLLIEVGKTDLRDPSDLARSHPAIRYLVYDLITEIERQPDLVGAAFGHVLGLVAAGALALPAPVVRPVAEAAAVMKDMARGRHQGKMVLSFAPAPRPVASVAEAEDAVAIIGLAGRFPGAEGLEALWQLRRSGASAIGPVPDGRWSSDELERCAGGLDGRGLLRGGFLATAEQMDAGFFGISPREAMAMDPRQRLLLEESYLALADAGHVWQEPGRPLRAAVGVFVAADPGDYVTKRLIGGRAIDALELPGVLGASLPARLAHVLGLEGPAESHDLACAGSLGALAAAITALRQGRCGLALVASASVLATPLLSAQLQAAGLLSASGGCHAFRGDADGMVPAEASVALVLKPLAAARRDGDLVHAVLRGAAMRQAQGSGGFCSPAPDAQAALHAELLATLGLGADGIDLVAAHGIGTAAGDAAELTALGRSFAGRRGAPVPVTTIKPVLGHAIAAGGLVALVDAVLQLRREQLLPLPAAERAPWLPALAAAGLEPVAAARPWPGFARGRPRRVLLNAFAITGGQGAALIEEAPRDLARPPAELVRPAPHRFVRRRFWPEMAVSAVKPPAPAEPRDRLRPILAALLQQDEAEIDLERSPAEAGIESLLALDLHHRLRRELGVELPVVAILAAERLADLLPAGRAAAPVATEEALPADEAPHAPFALTELQAAYLVGREGGMQLGGGGCHVYWELDRPGGLDPARLEAGWNRLVALHPMLRAVVEGTRQRVLEQVPPCRIELHDLRHLPPAAVAEERARLGQRFGHQHFDPARWPLFHLALSRAGDGDRLHLSFDLLVIDVASLYRLLADWGRLHDAPDLHLPAPAATFRQCVQALERMRETEPWRADAAYWDALGPELPPAPALPVQHEGAGTGELRTERYQARIEPAVWARLRAQARAQRLSPTVAVLTAFAAMLARWSQASRFTLNLTLSNRSLLGAMARDVVGDLSGTLLLDLDLAEPRGFADHARRVADRLAAHLEHGRVSGIRTLRRLAALRGVETALMPVVFTSMLGYQPSGEGDAPISTLGRLVHGATQTPQVWLDAQLQEDEGAALLSWDVAAGLLAPPLAGAMFDAWVRTVLALAEAEGWQADPVAAILAQERTQRDHDGDYPPLEGVDAPLFMPFLRRAEASPDRPALIAPDRTLDYGELRATALVLAARLRAAGAVPETLVAVALERGWRQVVAVIAVQMAGAAYLPLDPELPPTRLRLLAERGEVRIAIADPARDLAWPDGVTVLAPPEAPLAASAEVEPPATVEPTSLAYVIFTSGSTGEPKGVMIEHAAALNTCLDINRRMGIGADDRVLALSALNFDLSVWDIFGMLAAGGAIVLPEPRSFADPDHLADLCRRHGVTVWNSVPMFLELFLAAAPSAETVARLGTVMLSGDWIPLGLPGRIRALRPEVRVHSLGGATEAAIWSIHHPVAAEPLPGWSSVPYGRAMTGQGFRVLDEALADCPDGVSGELFITGKGLARGYWRDQARTDAAFIRDPASGERLYRTGDLGRWREDGLIEFQGRRDGQVKIDGFRVELGEIEAALRALPGVQEAVAVAPRLRDGRRRLVAFCIAAGTDGRALQERLAARLPVYMVPRRIELLDRFPLSANQKVDRKALGEMALAEQPILLRPAPVAAPQPVRPAGTALVPELQRIWQEILADSGRPGTAGPPPADRNLFEFGADSLMAVAASRTIARKLGAPCSVTDIFEHPTIERLAAFLAARAPAPAEGPKLASSLNGVHAASTQAGRAMARRQFRMDLA